MITERTLKRWRIDALKYPQNSDSVQTLNGLEMATRIVRLTQELMDLYLIRKG